MQLRSPPAGADDATKLAYASFAAIGVILPHLTPGTIEENSMRRVMADLAEIYGQGETPAAAWIRDTFGAMAR